MPPGSLDPKLRRPWSSSPWTTGLCSERDRAMIEVCSFPRESGSARTRSPHRSAAAGWATSTAPGTRGSSRDVAVKVLPAKLAGDEERQRRFEVEARAASTLNHPNIVAIHDIGSHDGAPYVVQELLEGETLRERLDEGALSTRKAVDYALQIARGLAAAHARGVVHRDLKPANLFITRDGVVKILDFGLAKLTHERRRGERLGRHRPADDDPGHDPRQRPGHGGLHVAGAGEGAGRRSPLRHLRLRRGALRDGHRAARLQGRQRGRDDERDPQGGAPGDLDHRARSRPRVSSA